MTTTDIAQKPNEQILKDFHFISSTSIFLNKIVYDKFVFYFSGLKKKI